MADGNYKLLALAFGHDALDFVQPTIGAGRLFDDIATHFAGAAALTCFGGTSLDAFVRPRSDASARPRHG